MRTLFLHGHTPRMDSGGALRSYGVVAALARNGPVELAYRGFDGPEPHPAYAALDGVTLTALELGTPITRSLAYARTRLRARGVPDWVARASAPSLSRAVREAPAGTRVVADGFVIAAAVLGEMRRRPVIYNAHNLESAHRPDGPALVAIERAIHAAAAESWHVSHVDLEAARALCPAAALRYAPNVVDVAAIATVAPAGQRRVLFAADHRYAPNATARAFLVDEVMPRLWAEDPQARLVVSGRGEIPAAADDRIEVRGFVDDLEALYASCDAVAVPLLSGGGSPLKFVEALARGLPVVATAHAARGLEVVAGEHFLEADGAGAFAAALARALRGDAAMAAAARELAEQRYSIEALAAMLRA